jgi:hypothetical protein
MPEGDTLRRIALNLERALLEGRVSAFFSTSAALEAAALRQRLVGTRVLGCEARGKHLLIHFESGAALHTHLGLHGSWRLHSRATLPPRLERRARVALETDRVVAACLGRGTTVELLPPGGVARHPGLLRLGPDLLAPDFDAGEAGARLCQEGQDAVECMRPELPIGPVEGGAEGQVAGGPRGGRSGPRRGAGHGRPRRSVHHHSEIVAGRRLELVMGPEPNPAWGRAPQDLPPRSAVGMPDE